MYCSLNGPMHQSILTPLHVMADNTAITTIQCIMIFGQHVLN